MSRPIPVDPIKTGGLVEAAADQEESTATLVMRFLPAWLTSLVFHLAILILLAMISLVLDRSMQGTGIAMNLEAGGGPEGLGDGSGDGVLEDALATSTELADPTVATSDVLAEADGLNTPVEDLTRFDLGEVLASAGGANTGEQIAGTPLGSPNGEGADGPNGFGGKPGGDGTSPVRTAVFGLAAEGSKFVYVFDHSESMNSVLSYSSEGVTVFSVTPLEAAKAELLRSLQDLNKQQMFQIIFYNHEQDLFKSSRSASRLNVATPDAKRKAADFVAKVPGVGNTNHLRPLELALRMKPDVIFLLTDGEAKDDLTTDQLVELKKLNKGHTRINVIHFCYSPRPDSTLVKLAKENGGTHVFFNIARLGPGATGMPGMQPPGAMPQGMQGAQMAPQGVPVPFLDN